MRILRAALALAALAWGVAGAQTFNPSLPYGTIWDTSPQLCVQGGNNFVCGTGALVTGDISSYVYTSNGSPANLAFLNPSTLVGNPTAAYAPAVPITLGSGLAFSGTSLSATGGTPGGAAGGQLGGTYPNPTVLSVTGDTTSTPIAAGLVGEGIILTCADITATVSFTSASPTVITWTGLAASSIGIVSQQAATTWTCPIYFTGTVPTGVTANQAYYIVSRSINYTNGTFNIVDTAAHAIACLSNFGSCTGIVNTSSTGTSPTGVTGIFFGSGGTSSATYAAVGALVVPPGHFNCDGGVSLNGASSTTDTGYAASISAGINVGNNPFAITTTSTSLNTNVISMPLSAQPFGSNTGITVYANGFFKYSGGSTTSNAQVYCWRIG